MTTLNSYLPHRTPLVSYLPNVLDLVRNANCIVINFIEMEVHRRYFPGKYLKFQEKLRDTNCMLIVVKVLIFFHKKALQG